MRSEFPVFQQKWFDTSSYIFLLHIIILVLLYLLECFRLDFVLFGSALILLMQVQKQVFSVYQDNIEWYQPISGKTRKTISLQDITQVRYEDEYVSFFPKKTIVIYTTEDGPESSGTELNFMEYWSHNKTITLLHYFQQQGKDLRIKTTNKQLKERLQLSNWDS